MVFIMEMMQMHTTSETDGNNTTGWTNIYICSFISTQRQDIVEG